jgi:DMSO/TMAO reductase YedYZ molybdopterin-dependent catalytic subunit
MAEDEVVADFHCREGWSRLGIRWRGIRLAALLELAGATSAGRYVTVGSGDYAAVLPRGVAEQPGVLLALGRQGQPSETVAEFPRLVGPSDWDCFQSVKSVERIEVTREPGRPTAPAIALARLKRGEAMNASTNDE